MSSRLIAPEHYRKGAPDIDYTARNQWIADMAEAGHTQRELASALGVGVSAICQARRRHLGREPKAKPLVRAVLRPCLTCGKRFPSEGPHNRMCEGCRQRKSDPFSWR